MDISGWNFSLLHFFIHLLAASPYQEEVNPNII